MLNKLPIFLNCFGGGGSTMLVSLLVSNVNVCISSGETHKVFKPGTRFDAGWLGIKKRFFYDYPIRMLAGQDIFGKNLLEENFDVYDFPSALADHPGGGGVCRAAGRAVGDSLLGQLSLGAHLEPVHTQGRQQHDHR